LNFDQNAIQKNSPAAAKERTNIAAISSAFSSKANFMLPASCTARAWQA
jgi:hypothetical protein